MATIVAEPLSELAAGGVTPQLPEDMWQGLIGPPGVTNWAGAGKAGKGLAWAKVAACISRGWPFPPYQPGDPRVDISTVPTPGNVIIVSTEDAAAVVWHRVNANGGDMDKIFNLTDVPVSGSDTVARSTFALPRDFSYLSQQIAAIGDVRLVILDNLMSIATSTASFNQQVRLNIMNPLEEIGRNYGVRIILVNHFTKGLPKNGMSSSRNLADFIYGSLGVIQAARLTVVFLPDPDNDAVTSITTYVSNGAKAERPVRYVVDGEGENVRLLWEPPPLSLKDTDGMTMLVEEVLHAIAGATRPVTEQELAVWLKRPYTQVKQALNVALTQRRVHTDRQAWYVLALPAGTGMAGHMLEGSAA